MKDFFKNIIKADLEQWIGFIGLSLLATLSMVLVFSIVQDHEIECYYLHAYADTGFTVHKVYAFTNWQVDELVFASIDPDKAMETLSNLKQCASK